MQLTLLGAPAAVAKARAALESALDVDEQSRVVGENRRSHIRRSTFYD